MKGAWDGIGLGGEGEGGLTYKPNSPYLDQTKHINNSVHSTV